MERSGAEEGLLCREPAVMEQRLGRAEVLLYHTGSGQVGVLNETAHAIWQLCDGRHQAHQIAAALAARFAGTGDRDLARDVADVVETLRARGFLSGGHPLP